MNHNDLQILRHAALELQESSDDLVRVAGIFQRIKNWWKARFNREFAERQEQIEEAYGEVKVPLQTLQDQLNDMDKAFKNQDPDAVAGLVHTIPETIAEVNSNMGNLASQLQAADAAIPREYVDERGNVLSGDDLSWVQKGYRKNYDLLQRLWEFLPEDVKEIPIRQPINAPVESFRWFSHFSPDQIHVSEKVKSNARDRLRDELLRKWKGEEVEYILDQGFDTFIENLKVKILGDATLMKMDWANISKEVQHRPVNQMMYEIRPGWVPLPVQGVELLVNVLFVKVNDLKSARRGTDQLSIYMIGTMKVEPDARQKLKQGIENQQSGASLPEAETEEIEPLITEPEDLEIQAEGPITSLVKQALRRKQLEALTAIYGIVLNGDKT